MKGVVQEGEGEIAEALVLAEHFSEGGPICVMLGDNIYAKYYENRDSSLQAIAQAPRKSH